MRQSLEEAWKKKKKCVRAYKHTTWLTVYALTHRGSCCNCNNCTRLFIIKTQSCGWIENFALMSPNGFPFTTVVSPTSLRNGKDPIVSLWHVSWKKTELGPRIHAVAGKYANKLWIHFCILIWRTKEQFVCPRASMNDVFAVHEVKRENFWQNISCTRYISRSSWARSQIEQSY